MAVANSEKAIVGAMISILEKMGKDLVPFINNNARDVVLYFDLHDARESIKEAIQHLQAAEKEMPDEKS